MRIKVDNWRYANNKTLVHFHSQIGNAFGEWNFDGIGPKIGHYYLAEFTISKPLTWGNDIKYSISRSAEIGAIDDKTVLITGQLISLKDVDHWVINVKEDEIICFIIGSLYAAGEFVEVTTCCLEIWPHLEIGPEPNVEETMM